MKADIAATVNESQPGLGMKGTVAAIYATFFLSGVATTIYGSTVIYLIQDYHISMLQAGLFATFMAVGRLFSVLISGILTDRLGRKLILVTGAACMTLSFIGIGSISLFNEANIR